MAAMPSGSKAVTMAPRSCRAGIMESAGDSRMSSVSALKVRPRTATLRPRKSPPRWRDTFSAIASFLRLGWIEQNDRQYRILKRRELEIRST